VPDEGTALGDTFRVPVAGVAPAAAWGPHGFAGAGPAAPAPVHAAV